MFGHSFESVDEKSAQSFALVLFLNLKFVAEIKCSIKHFYHLIGSMLLLTSTTHCIHNPCQIWTSYKPPVALSCPQRPNIGPNFCSNHSVWLSAANQYHSFDKTELHFVRPISLPILESLHPFLLSICNRLIPQNRLWNTWQTVQQMVRLDFWFWMPVRWLCAVKIHYSLPHQSFFFWLIF